MAARKKKATLTPSFELIEKAIYLVRGHKVMLDADLAELYGVETRALIQAVKRNKKRFPPDFAFRLTPEEWRILRSQIVISRGRGGRRYQPYVFTEQGVAMLSSVLHSERAIQVNVQIMRVFVRLRELMITHRDLATKLDELEKKFQQHEQHFAVVFDAIRRLLEPDQAVEKPRIGFSQA
jgi:hypothetical protein